MNVETYLWRHLPKDFYSSGKNVGLFNAGHLIVYLGIRVSFIWGMSFTLPAFVPYYLCCIWFIELVYSATYLPTYAVLNTFRLARNTDSVVGRKLLAGLCPAGLGKGKNFLLLDW